MELNGVTIDDTYAEAFPTWICRIIITAVTKNGHTKQQLRRQDLQHLRSVVPVRQDLNVKFQPVTLLDGRPGVAIQICTSKKKIKDQVVERFAECVLTSPTTAVF